ncbi:DUF6010 family protein [Amycolatopsis jiangsuensis]|nr:DUF6010 family protein [Amycolatopsis jiangsuensis]
MVIVTAVLVGLAYVALQSFLPEPACRKVDAVLVAGAGAAYLSGGSMGGWEFVFTAAVTYCAYRGLESYPWIGVAWLLHTGWDVVHHLRGTPIIPFAAHSSLGCAFCDPIIAVWCLGGGPSVHAVLARLRPAGSRA